jgi:hypothetical protein
MTAATIAKPVMTPAELARFDAKVDRSAGPDGCHIWTGSRSTAGYGQLQVDGRLQYAHRLALGYHRGSPLGADEMALHHCDSPPCVNPSHLYAGDQKANMRDCAARGRANLDGLALGRAPGKTLGKFRVGPEQCGTPRGYSRHLRHGEPTCGPCREARNAYNRARVAAQQ